MAVTALAVGITTDDSADRDQQVYLTTLELMREGQSYYPAFESALIQHVGDAPSQIRSVRPPTLFLALRFVPSSALRASTLFLMFAVLVLAGMIASRYGPRAVVAAPLASGLWLVSASPLLYLHGEFWGLLALLAAVFCLQTHRDAGAAVWLLIATVIRETFGIALLIALIHRRSRPWTLASAAAMIFYAIHFFLGRTILQTDGTEAAFGNEPRTITNVLSWMSPGNRPVSWAIGLLSVVLGLSMMRTLRDRDGAASIGLWYSVVALMLTIATTRFYWSLLFGPLLSIYASSILEPKKSVDPTPRELIIDLRDDTVSLDRLEPEKRLPSSRQPGGSGSGAGTRSARRRS